MKHINFEITEMSISSYPPNLARVLPPISVMCQHRSIHRVCEYFLCSFRMRTEKSLHLQFEKPMDDLKMAFKDFCWLLKLQGFAVGSIFSKMLVAKRFLLYDARHF